MSSVSLMHASTELWVCMLVMYCLEGLASLLSSIFSGCYSLSTCFFTESWMGRIWWGNQPVDAQHKTNSTISLEGLCLIMLSQLIFTFTFHVTDSFMHMDSGFMFLWDSYVQTYISPSIFHSWAFSLAPFLLFVLSSSDLLIFVLSYVFYYYSLDASKHLRWIRKWIGQKQECLLFCPGRGFKQGCLYCQEILSIWNKYE